MVSSKHKLAVAMASLLFGSMTHAGDYTFTTGAEYTNGEYGTGIDTHSWYVPFTVGYLADNFAWSVTVPFIHVDGSTLVTGIRNTPIPGPGGGGGGVRKNTAPINETRVDSGLGDIILRASYLLQQETPVKPWLALTGKVKLGTADETKNLGTGENDYSVQLEAAKGAFDGMVGYTVIGDTNTFDYDNIAYGTAALTLPLHQNWKARAELYAAQAAHPDLDPVRELTVSFDTPLSKDRHMSLYAIKGFTDSSPDWGMGLLVSSGF